MVTSVLDVGYVVTAGKFIVVAPPLLVVLGFISQPLISITPTRMARLMKVTLSKRLILSLIAYAPFFLCHA